MKHYLFISLLVAIFFSGLGGLQVEQSYGADVGWCPCYSKAWPPDDAVVYFLNPFTGRLVPIPIKKHQFSCENEGAWEHYHSTWTGVKAQEERQRAKDEIAQMVILDRL